LIAIAYLYLLPAAEVLVPLAVGIALLRRKNDQRCFGSWAYAIGVTVASGITLLIMTLFFSSMLTANGMERIGLFIGPVIPLILIPSIAVFLYCCLVLWAYYRPSRFRERGFSNIPGPRQARVTGGILALAATATVVWLLPYIHMFPYTALYYQGNTRAYELSGRNLITDNNDHILTLYNDDWPKIDPRFDLQLDWRGRVVLKVRDLRYKRGPEITHVYYLPFEPATYVLNNGVPTKVKDTTEPVDWSQ
jgi:hypothetical protein